MADAKKYDRCGGFYVCKTGRRENDVAVFKRHEWNTLDLCDDCKKELQEFFDFNKADKEAKNGASN